MPGGRCSDPEQPVRAPRRSRAALPRAVGAHMPGFPAPARTPHRGRRGIPRSSLMGDACSHPGSLGISRPGRTSRAARCGRSLASPSSASPAGPHRVRALGRFCGVRGLAARCCHRHRSARHCCLGPGRHRCPAGWDLPVAGAQWSAVVAGAQWSAVVARARWPAARARWLAAGWVWRAPAGNGRGLVPHRPAWARRGAQMGSRTSRTRRASPRARPLAARAASTGGR